MRPAGCFAAWLALGALARAGALRAQLVVEPGDPALWAGAAALFVATASFDADISAAAAHGTGTSLDRLAGTLQPAGLERWDVAALAGGFVAARLAGRRPGDAVLRIAAGYVVADLLESTLKWAVGRHRPDSTGGAPWRLEPITAHEPWQSFPSAHATHVFSIAAGIASEVRQPAVRAAAYGVAALVGWERIESRAHWPSDVVAGAVLGVAASRTVNRWLRRPRGPGRGAGRLRLVVAPNVVGVSVPLGP